MNNDRIDILLASFNGALFLEKQLDSILAQTHRNFLLIIRDDQSTDGTGQIIESYSSRFPEKIRLLPSKERLGPKGNFSRLMDSSDAPYIMFSDQDDFWEPGKVALTLEAMKRMENDAPFLVHTDLKVVDRNLKLISSSFWRYTGIRAENFQTLNRLLMQNAITGCTMMINRPLLRLALPIPEDSAMHDWWIALVAAAFGRIEALPEPTLSYRQHGKNTLGAQRFLSLGYFKQGLEKLRHPETAKQAQARELLVRYGERLDENKKQMLNAFLLLPVVSLFEKAALIFQYRFFKSGLLRNAVNILFKQQ